MHRRRATALLSETKKELEELERAQARCEPKQPTLVQESSLFAIFVDDDDDNDHNATAVGDTTTTAPPDVESPFRPRRVGGATFSTTDGSKSSAPFHHQQHDTDVAAPGSSVGFTEANFLNFLETGRRQANETMRRKTDAKLEAISQLAVEDRAAAYCETHVNPNQQMTLEDLQWHDPLDQSFTVMGASIARHNRSMTAAATRHLHQVEKRGSVSGGGESPAAVGSASGTSGLLLQVPSSGGGALSSSDRSNKSQQQQTMTTTTTTKRQASSSPTGSQYSPTSNAAVGRGEGLRQMRAAQSAAAMANEQQLKIVEWRNAPDSETFVEVKKKDYSFLRSHEIAALQQEEEQQQQQHAAADMRQQQRRSPPGDGRVVATTTTTDLRRRKSPAVERIPVGFVDMAVDEAGFDAAVTALTAESQVVQRAGRRARWWEQQRENALEKEFRDRVSAAVDRGEKSLSESKAKEFALESLLPSAFWEAQLEAQVIFAEGRARWVVEAAERFERNEMIVEFEDDC